MAQTATTAGAVPTPYPTIQTFSIAWAITGDSDNNGVVSVRYRKQGAADWRTGMSLTRVPADHNTTGSCSYGSGGGKWGNHHAGSLFDLEPQTTYEIELTLTVVRCGDGFGCYADATWKRALFRNNIFIGGTGGGTYGRDRNGSGRVLDLADVEASCSFDYDGLGSIGTGEFEGKIGRTHFTSVASMQSSTTEVHGQQMDMSVFAAKVSFPSSPLLPKAAPDLRLDEANAAVDAGIAIIGLGGYSGTAPDLGAYELGAALPVHGPRTAGATVRSGTGGRHRP